MVMKYPLLEFVFKTNPQILNNFHHNHQETLDGNNYAENDETEWKGWLLNQCEDCLITSKTCHICHTKVTVVRAVKGHASSMNVLVSLVSSPYLLYLEDDWRLLSVPVLHTSLAKIVEKAWPMLNNPPPIVDVDVAMSSKDTLQDYRTSSGNMDTISKQEIRDYNSSDKVRLHYHEGIYNSVEYNGTEDTILDYSRRFLNPLQPALTASSYALAKASAWAHEHHKRHALQDETNTILNESYSVDECKECMPQFIISNTKPSGTIITTENDSIVTMTSFSTTVNVKSTNQTEASEDPLIMNSIKTKNMSPLQNDINRNDTNLQPHPFRILLMAALGILQETVRRHHNELSNDDDDDGEFVESVHQVLFNEQSNRNCALGNYIISPAESDTKSSSSSSSSSSLRVDCDYSVLGKGGWHRSVPVVFTKKSVHFVETPFYQQRDDVNDNGTLHEKKSVRTNKDSGTDIRGTCCNMSEEFIRVSVPYSLHEFGLAPFIFTPSPTSLKSDPVDSTSSEHDRNIQNKEIIGAYGDRNHEFTYWPSLSLNPGLWNLQEIKKKINRFLDGNSSLSSKDCCRRREVVNNEIFTETEVLFEHKFSTLCHAAGLQMAYLPSLLFEHIGGDVSAYVLNGVHRPWD